MRIGVEVCLPRDAATLPVIRHIAVCALDELGVASEAVDDVALALTEACTNVVKHSGVDDEYEVHLVVTDDVCEISVVDRGRGFDPSTDATGMAPGTAEQGRGLALLSALVDGVRFESRPEEGTVVHLVKQLDVVRDGPLGRYLDGALSNHDRAGDGRGNGDGPGREAAAGT